ncbi:unnamed protein product [Camellia sinensis]
MINFNRLHIPLFSLFISPLKHHTTPHNTKQSRNRIIRTLQSRHRGRKVFYRCNLELMVSTSSSSSSPPALLKRKRPVRLDNSEFGNGFWWWLCGDAGGGSGEEGGCGG